MPIYRSNHKNVEKGRRHEYRVRVDKQDGCIERFVATLFNVTVKLLYFYIEF